MLVAITDDVWFLFLFVMQLYVTSGRSHILCLVRSDFVINKNGETRILFCFFRCRILTSSVTSSIGDTYRLHTGQTDIHTHTPSRAGDRHVLWTRDRHVLWTRDMHALWTRVTGTCSGRRCDHAVAPDSSLEACLLRHNHSKQHLKRSHTTRQITAADSRLASARIISLANISVISPKRVRIHLSVSDWERRPYTGCPEYWNRRPHRLPRVRLRLSIRDLAERAR